MGGKKVCRLVWLLLRWGGLCGIQREEDIAVAMPNLLACFYMALHLYMYSWKQIYGEFAMQAPWILEQSTHANFLTKGFFMFPSSIYLAQYIFHILIKNIIYSNLPKFWTTDKIKQYEIKIK